MTRLPALRKNLADALDELGKIPDYSSIGPASVHLGPDGALSFAYTLDGQKMVATGADLAHGWVSHSRRPIVDYRQRLRSATPAAATAQCRAR